MKYYTQNKAPHNLPFRIVTEEGYTRTGLPSLTNQELADLGYYPAPEKPSYDPYTQSISWDTDDWVISDTPEKVAPIPVKQNLSKYAFLTLLKQVGITNEQIATAKADTNLTAFWILFDAADEINPTDNSTIEGLGALETLGYLTSAETVFDMWPTN